MNTFVKRELHKRHGFGSFDSEISPFWICHLVHNGPINNYTAVPTDMNAVGWIAFSISDDIVVSSLRIKESNLYPLVLKVTPKVPLIAKPHPKGGVTYEVA
jgi:hypothetical protein